MIYANGEFPQNLNNDFKEIFSKWSFELSDFQKWAIYSICNNNDTLVCAPTGSGKTLPAEYAIDHFTKLGKKVIYTTPIKALSNDKLAELTQKFPNLSFGLLTGDNKFNPEAQVLIMTTEIYLNTLLKLMFLKTQEDYDIQKLSLDFNINIEEELGIVIHDEIHYINDRDRGHVWEKSIINQPKNIPYIGLSATIATPQTLCNWSQKKAKRGEIYLCESTFRNVPLAHYSFITMPESKQRKTHSKNPEILETCDKLILLKYKNEPFKENNYSKIKKTLKYIYDNKIQVKDTFIFNQVIEYVRQNNLLPGLVFVFSRKQCYRWAKMIERSLFEEGSLIPSIIEKEAKQILIKKLTNWKEYVALPEFANIIKLLQKGIAVHHSGVTPVFREMIELLYRKQYIKLLIATETFAIGVNVAIKSVIYTGLQKFDGKGFRFLYSHEYAQGAGRAGRRGKDTKGTIIHLNNIYDRKDGNPTPTIYRKILSGRPEDLSSKFCIDFNLIISMLISGNTNFIDYANSSMLSKEVKDREETLQTKLQEMTKKSEDKTITLQYINTPIETLSDYHNKQNSLNGLSRKKRKKMELQCLNIEQSHKTFKDDYQKYLESLHIKEEICKIENTVKNTKEYVNDEISLHTTILKREGFIDGDFKDNNYENLTLSLKGQMAANIHETHSLATAETLYENYFDDLTVEELISVISIFTPLKLSEENSYVNINDTLVNNNIKRVVTIIKKKLHKYYDIETAHQTNFTNSYDIHYNMCEFMYQWCFAEDDIACRKIYDEAKSYDIYMGEFVKCILKIVNIANELQKACIVQENIKLLHTLSFVKEKMLKSVATNQSLYV